MKTRNLMYSLVVIATLLASPVAYSAPSEWRCFDGTGTSDCYVTRVRWSNTSTTYVEARIANDVNSSNVCNTADHCCYLKMQIGAGGVDTVNDLRAVESLLLTALTTGLPIAYKIIDGDDYNYCEISEIVIEKP